MINPTEQVSRFSRREALQTVGATVALAAVSGASDLTGGAYAATTPVNASDSAGPGFWPNGARLAVSLSLMFEAGGAPISWACGRFAPPIENRRPGAPPTPVSPY